jgi:hypothetical protein
MATDSTVLDPGQEEQESEERDKNHAQLLSDSEDTASEGSQIGRIDDRIIEVE